MAATRLLASNWIVAAAMAAAVSVMAPAAARATESADDPVSIREHAVAASTMVSSRAASERDGATAPMAGLGPMTGLADVGGPITDRGKIPGAQSEKVVQEFTGVASWYGPGFHGRRTANGEKFNQNELTAAHKTLPFGTEVLVRSLQTGREVLVRIIDRGPHLKSRIIDLSHAAAEALGIRQHGVSEVQLIEP